MKRSACWRRALLACSLGMTIAACDEVSGDTDGSSQESGGPTVDDDGSAEDSGLTSGGGESTGTETCPDGSLSCAGTCVDEQTDVSNCGGCGQTCSDGDLCSAGQCVEAPADCSAAGATCPDGHYCDVASRTCVAGCAFDDDCPQPGFCDLASNTCSCDPGSNACGGACVPESAAVCGPKCTECTDAPAYGSPSCNASQCGYACDPGYHACDDACVASDSVDHCEGACSPCPTDPNGTATCGAQGCALACDAGFHLAAGSCEANCEPGACGNNLFCDGVACQACPEAPGESEPNDDVDAADTMPGMAAGGGVLSNAYGVSCGAGDIDVWTTPQADQYPTKRWVFTAMNDGIWQVTVRQGSTVLASRTCSEKENCNAFNSNGVSLFGSTPPTIHVELLEGSIPQAYEVGWVQL